MQIAQTTFSRYNHTLAFEYYRNQIENDCWPIRRQFDCRKLILRMEKSSPILIMEGRVFRWLVWIAERMSLIRYIILMLIQFISSFILKMYEDDRTKSTLSTIDMFNAWA